MTGALLVSIYLIVLAGFLGLDMLAKVPQTLYGVVLAAIGTLSAVALVAALYIEWNGLAGAAVALASAGAVGGLVGLGQFLRVFRKKSRPA